jgi:hypothetical protein
MRPMTSIVTLGRDVWDWLLYAVTAVAAIAAIIAFLPWAAERRRRPEVRILWSLSTDSDSAHMVTWGPDEVPEVKAREPFLVGAAIQNTGDKASTDTLINFVVPDCFELCQSASQEEPARSANETAGLPPDFRVVFFAPRPGLWAPANFHLLHYRLRYAGPQRDEPLKVRLLFRVSDGRFNGSGRRLLPSIVPILENVDAAVGTPWPPEPARRRRIRRARAEPHGRVVCLPGERSDVRDVIVLPDEEGPEPPVASSTTSRTRLKLRLFRSLRRPVSGIHADGRFLGR